MKLVSPFTSSRFFDRRINRGKNWIALLLMMVAAPYATANLTMALQPVDLGAGFSLTGRLTIDGTRGALSSANILDWHLTVTSVTDFVYDRSNTRNLSSLVGSDGLHLTVPTSPDGAQDGGALVFYGSPYFQVRVADFTGPNASGGQAYYGSGGAFDSVALNQANNRDYLAATLGAGGGNSFDLVPKHFANGVAMTGTIVTDGGLGAAAIVDWNILVRETMRWNFDRANSALLSAIGLSFDGSFLKVTPFDADSNPGSFLIGSYGVPGGVDPTEILLADFTNNPDGEAGFINPIIYQTISPLPLDSQGLYRVTQAIPEPATFGVIAVLCLAVVAARRRLARSGTAG